MRQTARKRPETANFTLSDTMRAERTTRTNTETAVSGANPSHNSYKWEIALKSAVNHSINSPHAQADNKSGQTHKGHSLLSRFGNNFACLVGSHENSTQPVSGSG